VKKIEMANDKKIKELEPYVEKILKTLGYSVSEVIVTDESYITDFINVFYTKEQKNEVLKNISKKLGIEVLLKDTIYEVAEKCKNL
jgi:hypothetical protein